MLIASGVWFLARSAVSIPIERVRQRRYTVSNPYSGTQAIESEIIIDILLVFIERIAENGCGVIFLPIRVLRGMRQMKCVGFQVITDKRTGIELVKRSRYDQLIYPVSGDDTIDKRRYGLRFALLQIIDKHCRRLFFRYCLNTDIRAPEVRGYGRMNEIMRSSVAIHTVGRAVTDLCVRHQGIGIK